MDWRSIAIFLANRVNKPLVLLDALGKIRLISLSMQQILGWQEDDIVGRPWQQACVPHDLAHEGSRWLSLALRGVTVERTCEVVTWGGERLLLDVDIALVGAAPEHGIAIVVESVTPKQQVAPHSDTEDVDYEIAVDADTFGELHKVVRTHSTQTLPPGSTLKCFELLRLRKTPCEDCPVLRASADSWPRTVIRNSTPLGGFSVVTATKMSGHVAHVSVRAVSEATLTAIRKARLNDLAERVHLTQQEQLVLSAIVDGQSTDDIARTLDIRPRTVRFHQVNLQRKLGVTCRADLLRLLL